MAEVVKFIAESREGVGKGAVRALRRTGMMPGILYGGDGKDRKLAVSLNAFNREYQKGSFQTKLVEIMVDGEAITAIPKAVQLHPVTDIPEHVDFMRVGKDTTVRVFINVKVINEEKSIGVKRGGIVNIVHRMVEFSCHPGNIPHHIEVDIAGLDIGHNAHIHAITLPEGIIPVDKTNFTVVSIVARVAEEDKKPSETTVASETAAPAATEEKKA